LSRLTLASKSGRDNSGNKPLTFDGIDIEAFDPQSWPQRPQYMEFLAKDGFVLCDVGDGANVKIVSPPLLLREKLITHHDRQGSKAVTDRFDIDFLLEYCKSRQLVLDIRGDDETSKSARKGLEKFK